MSRLSHARQTPEFTRVLDEPEVGRTPALAAKTRGSQYAHMNYIHVALFINLPISFF